MNLMFLEMAEVLERLLTVSKEQVLERFPMVPMESEMSVTRMAMIDLLEQVSQGKRVDP